MSAARRTAAIMQPTYLPYLGYFHLVAASDVFVFLDDVQFARRSWQSRNRILGPGGEVMLTVPVKKHERDTPISAIEVFEGEPWREKHLKAISLNYARRPAFAEGMAFLEETLAGAGLLADLNRRIVEGAARKMGLATEFVNARDLACPGHRSDHLLAICRAVGASDYLSPMGSHDYMEDDGVFAEAGFPVRFQGFVEIAYPQGREPFIPYMSFVDALMNLGWDGLAGLIGQMREREA
jgi:hypothetical protein